MKIIFITMILCFALTGLFGCKDNSTTPTNYTVNGEWEGQVEMVAGNISYNLNLNLAQVGTTVGGTGNFKITSFAGSKETPIPALTGTFENNVLDITIPGSTDLGGYKGTMQSDGKSIVGNMNYQSALVSMTLKKK